MGTDAAETPKMVAIGDGFFLRQAVDNIAWIDMGDYAIVVDALEQPELEDEVMSAIGQTLGEKPIRYVLNTHTHYDHVALNEAFQRRFGSEIVNQLTCTIPPDGRRFEGERRHVVMLPMPGIHTAEDCVVWVEEDRALFVGDIFGWGLIPLLAALSVETERRLLETYSRLIDFEPVKVIPGHGPVCGVCELRRWVDYYHWLVAQVSKACAGGGTDAEILRDISPPQDMQAWWRFVQWKHQDSVGKVLRAVRRGRLQQ